MQNHNHMSEPGISKHQPELDQEAKQKQGNSATGGKKHNRYQDQGIDRTPSLSEPPWTTGTRGEADHGDRKNSNLPAPMNRGREQERDQKMNSSRMTQKEAPTPCRPSAPPRLHHLREPSTEGQNLTENMSSGMNGIHEKAQLIGPAGKNRETAMHLPQEQPARKPESVPPAHSRQPQRLKEEDRQAPYFLLYPHSSQLPGWPGDGKHQTTTGDRRKRTGSLHGRAHEQDNAAPETTALQKSPMTKQEEHGPHQGAIRVHHTCQ
ncbi:hypothetical protein NDU88_006146 [Pleurodeles waltl]|uniref:Uncharacterized protein n=1 Tax=Pleurodeles waltl TaxID=8319 RepID=A0AAV7TWT5_PLEWA|nr:hypothetical protein NDU88_006146 [Pleurodeles waltl]